MCYTLITPRRALVSLQGALGFHKTAVSSAGVSQVRQFRCFFREKASPFTGKGSVLLRGALDQDCLKTSSRFAWSVGALRGAGCGLGGVAGHTAQELSSAPPARGDPLCCPAACKGWCALPRVMRWCIARGARFLSSVMSAILQVFSCPCTACLL